MYLNKSTTIMAGILLGIFSSIVLMYLVVLVFHPLDKPPRNEAVPAVAQTEQKDNSRSDDSIAETSSESVSDKNELTEQQKEKLLSIYMDNMSVVGDSIAYGFNAYGYIPDELNLAQGSIAIRNIHDFPFEFGGVPMDVMDVLKQLQPPYIYMSMGMNDVNITSAEEYAETYKEAITTITEICPDSNIIVAAITPITPDSGFTPISNITEFNSLLRSTVEEFNSPTIQFFDAYSVISDPASGYMKFEYSGGDGIHLATKAYDDFILSLNTLILQMPVPDVVMEEINKPDAPPPTDSAAPESSSADSAADAVPTESFV